MTALLSDNGGTTFGGDDNLTHTFTITVRPVNDAPTFVKGADQSLHEEGTSAGDGPVAPRPWLAGRPASTRARPESGQTVLAYHVLTNDHPLLFNVRPTIARMAR